MFLPHQPKITCSVQGSFSELFVKRWVQGQSLKSRIQLFPTLCDDLGLIHPLPFSEMHFCVSVQKGI